MSDERLSLALSFIAAHPNAAARVLEQHPPPEIAELLSQLSHHHAVAVLQRMLPRAVARLAGVMSPGAFAGLLKDMEVSFAAAVLRQLPTADRQTLLNLLPNHRRSACSLMLSFPPDEVGAWLTPQVVTVPDDCTVEESLALVRDAGDAVYGDDLFVLDRDRRLRGTVNQLELWRTPPTTPVSRLIRPRSHSLLARMSLTKATEHAEWETLDVMPVVNRNHQFLGILRHVDLRNGLERLNTSLGRPTPIDPVSGIFEVYGKTLLALLNSLGDVIESDQKKP